MKRRFLVAVLATCMPCPALAQAYVPDVVFFDGFEPPPAPAIGDLNVTEVMPNPADPLLDTAAEWIEIQSAGTRTLLLTGCELRDAGGGSASLTGLALTPGALLLAARSLDSGENGGLLPAVLFTFTLNNTLETVAIHCNSVLLDQLSYTISTAGASILVDAVGQQCEESSASYWTNNFGTPAQANLTLCP
jgi:hypothetical protein